MVAHSFHKSDYWIHTGTVGASKMPHWLYISVIGPASQIHTGSYWKVRFTQITHYSSWAPLKEGLYSPHSHIQGFDDQNKHYMRPLCSNNSQTMLF